MLTKEQLTKVSKEFSLKSGQLISIKLQVPIKIRFDKIEESNFYDYAINLKANSSFFTICSLHSNQKENIIIHLDHTLVPFLIKQNGEITKEEFKGLKEIGNLILDCLNNSLKTEDFDFTFEASRMEINPIFLSVMHAKQPIHVSSFNMHLSDNSNQM